MEQLESSFENVILILAFYILENEIKEIEEENNVRKAN